MEMSVAIPLDADGFIRRECPSCCRQFKWFHGRVEAAPPDWVDPDSYFCPYCGVSASVDSWLTHAQLDIVKATVLSQMSSSIQSDLEAMTRNVNRQGGLIRMSVSRDMNVTNVPPPLSEPNDMVAVAPPCHSFEPIKVLEDWVSPIHCLVCGAQFVIG